MNSIDVDILNAAPEPRTDTQLVETLTCLVVKFDFDPGKTTRKSRKRILDAIVRVTAGVKSDEDGLKEKDTFVVMQGKLGDPERLVAMISTSIKNLPDVQFVKLNISFRRGNLYLMGAGKER